MTTQPIRKTVTSKDGATISYFEYPPTPSTTVANNETKNNNPGLIILHGGLESHLSHADLAQTLSSTTNLSIFLPDRRGRGLSCPPGPSFTLQTEINDLEALLIQTGARSIAAISSGAIITLAAALALCPQSSSSSLSSSPLAPENLIHKIAIFEPPILVGDVSAFDEARSFFAREIDAGDTGAALATAMKLTEMGPWVLRVLPKPLLAPVVRWALARESAGESAAGGGGLGASEESPYSMRRLAPTMRYDFQLVSEIQGSLVEEVGLLEGREVDVLFMSAGRSPAYLKRTMEALEKSVPKAKRVRFEALDHLGLGNRATGGDPELVASELRKFLL